MYMKYFLAVFTALSLFTHTSLQANSTSVYKSPSSGAHSGQMNVETLNKKTSHVISKQWQKVTWGEDTIGWIRHSLVFDEWNLARRVFATESTPLRKRPFWTSNPTHELKRGTSLKILRVQENWLEVETKKLSGWVDKAQVAILPNHWGYMVTRQKTPLRTRPTTKSKPTSTLKPGVRVTPKSFSGEFVEIEWEGKRQFAPFYSLLSRLDYAKKIRVKSGWKDVLFVIGELVQTNEDNFVKIEDIQALVGNDKRAFVISGKANLRKRPDPGSDVVKQLGQFYPLTILETLNIKWGKAQIAKNESLWWKTSDFIGERQPAISPKTHIKRMEISTAHNPKIQPEGALAGLKTLTTDALFGRKIFDMATSPKIPNLMFASADGIYKSLDGQSWEKVPQFGRHNYPLAVANDGTIYVGPYRSIDHGNTYSQFVRWDVVLNALAKKGVKRAQQVRLRDLEILDEKGNKISMTLKLGNKSEAVVTSLDRGHSWTLSKMSTSK